MTGPKRVLVIEDDLCLDTVLCRVLRSVSPGVEIDWLTSAEEAISRLGGARSSWRYDLVVTDISLSGRLTGLDFWEACREARPEVPVLLMSGMPLEKLFRRIGRESSVPPYLPKPFSVGECGRVFSALLEYGHRLRAGAAAV